MIYSPGSDPSPIRHVKINKDIVKLQPNTRSPVKNRNLSFKESAIIITEKVLANNITEKASHSDVNIPMFSKSNKTNSSKKHILSEDQLPTSRELSTSDQLTDAQDRASSQTNVEQPILTKDTMQNTIESQELPKIKKEPRSTPVPLRFNTDEELNEHSHFSSYKGSIITSSKSDNGTGSFIEILPSGKDTDNFVQEPSKITSSVDSNNNLDELRNSDLAHKNDTRHNLTSRSVASSGYISKPVVKKESSATGTKDNGSSSVSIALKPVKPQTLSNPEADAKQQSTESDSDDAFATAPSSPLLDASPIKLSYKTNNQAGTNNRFLARVNFTSVNQLFTAENIGDKSKNPSLDTNRNFRDKSVETISTNSNQETRLQNKNLKIKQSQEISDNDSLSQAKPTRDLQPEQSVAISKRTADLQINSKALSIARFKPQQPAKTIENSIVLIDRASQSKIMAESPYTMKEDLTIIKAVSDPRYINGAIKLNFFNLLAQITFGNQRTGEALRTRYRKSLVKTKDKTIELCRRQRVEPYLLDEFFIAYDNYVNEIAVQKQSSGSIRAGSTPNGHTNGGIRKGNFVPEEDVVLLQYVLEHSNESVCGRTLYKAFAAQNPWRSFQSWRNRFMRHLRPYVEYYAYREHWSSIPTHILNVLKSADREKSDLQSRTKKRKSKSYQSSWRTKSEETISNSQVAGLSDDSMFQDSRPLQLGSELEFDASDSDSIRTERNRELSLIKSKSNPTKKRKTENASKVIVISDSSASE